MLLRRLRVIPPMLIVISIAVFSLTSLAPGSTEAAILAGRVATPETLQSIREAYHLDDPLPAQYVRWVGNAIRLDFGNSFRSREAVSAVISRRVGVTAFLGVYAFIITAVFGVFLGIVAALKRGTTLDQGLVTLLVIGISAPAFASGLFLLYIFAVLLGWFPVFGVGDGFIDRVWHFTLPAVALALTSMALLMKLTRTSMIEALEQDYVVFARSRGLSERRVISVYALRNALIPVLTAAGLILGYMLTGTVLIEVTFALPGLGSLVVEAIQNKDIPVLQALVMLIAMMVVVVNLAVDLLYEAVDPRIRLDSVA